MGCMAMMHAGLRMLHAGALFRQGSHAIRNRLAPAITVPWSNPHALVWIGISLAVVIQLAPYACCACCGRSNCERDAAPPVAGSRHEAGG